MAYTLPEGLTELERRIFVYYLSNAQQDGVRAVIANQLACAQADEIDRTGVGFFRPFRFSTEAALDRLLPDGRVDLCFAEHPGLIGGAFFMLITADGVVSYVEAFTATGDWPLDEELFAFR